METKLLYALAAVLILFAISFWFAASSQGSYNKLVSDSTKAMGDKVSCSLGALDSDCSQRTDQSACETGTKCTWCSGSLDGSVVSTCRLAVCGCEGFYADKVTLSVDKKAYDQGSEMQASGTVEPAKVFTTTDQSVPQDRSDLPVQLSFLDGQGDETNALGSGAVVQTDGDGNFAWSFKVPTGRPGKYYLVAQFKYARDFAQFSIN